MKMTILHKLIWCWWPASGFLGAMFFMLLTLVPAIFYKGGAYLPHVLTGLGIYAFVVTPAALLKLWIDCNK